MKGISSECRALRGQDCGMGGNRARKGLMVPRDQGLKDPLLPPPPQIVSGSLSSGHIEEGDGVLGPVTLGALADSGGGPGGGTRDFMLGTLVDHGGGHWGLLHFELL